MPTERSPLDALHAEHRCISRRLARLTSSGAPSETQLTSAIERLVAHLDAHRRTAHLASAFASDAARLDSRIRLLLLRLVALVRLGSWRLDRTLAELEEAFREHVVMEEDLVWPDLTATHGVAEAAERGLQLLEAQEDASRRAAAALRNGAAPSPDVESAA
jgi:hypothetical protein